MEITFTDKKLEKLSSDYNKCRQKLGDRRAKLLITRLNAMRDAQTLEDVRNLLKTPSPPTNTVNTFGWK